MVDEESSGPVDPHQLLKALSPLLSDEGGAKGIPEVMRITNLMKDSKKLVSRCVYMTVLHATKDEEILDRFISAGGWDILNNWLQDSKGDESVPFLLELLKLYQQLPVTIDLLKKNNCAKSVKQLSKAEDERVKSISSELVSKWMDKIKSNKSSDSSNKQDSSKQKHSSDSSSKQKHKDKHKSSKEHSHHSSSHSHHKKHSPHKESKEKRSRDSTESKEEEETSHSKTKLPKESDEKSKSTAKMAPHKFRSTGLEQESVLPPSKKKKSSSDKPPVKRPSTSKLPSGEPPEKKSKPSATVTSTPTTSPSGKANITGITQEETPGKIKLIPPKPRQECDHEHRHDTVSAREVYESTGFMDAITTSYVPSLKIVKKKKPLTPPATSKMGPVPIGQQSNGPISPTSPPLPSSPPGKVILPSFYKDTLEDLPTSPVEEDKTGKTSPTKELEGKEEDAKEEDKENKDEDTKSVASVASSDSSSTKKKKKKVSWAIEKDLKTFFYFELDETERVNVNKLKNFEDVKKHETMMERKAIENAKKLHHDASNTKSTQGTIPWRMPELITGLTAQSSVVPGCNSTEIETQKQREQGVLQALFFSKHMIPDTAKEPDLEEVEYEEPRIIPLDDETGSGETLVDFTQKDNPVDSEPEDKSVQPNDPNLDPSAFSLPPDIATMLSSMAEQFQPDQPGGSTSQAAQAALRKNGPQPPAELMNIDFSQGIPEGMHDMLQSIVGNNQQNNKDDAWFQQIKTMIEPFKDQIQGMLDQSGANNNPTNTMGYNPGYGQPVPPVGSAMLGPPGPMPFGPMGMQPPPPPVPPPFMRGPCPPPHLMGGYPGPGGPPMFHGGRGPNPLMGHGGNRGGGNWGGRGNRGMNNQNRNRGHGQNNSNSNRPSNQFCRHFMKGGCQRGANCAFKHQESKDGSSPKT